MPRTDCTSQRSLDPPLIVLHESAASVGSGSGHTTEVGHSCPTRRTNQRSHLRYRRDDYPSYDSSEFSLYGRGHVPSNGFSVGPRLADGPAGKYHEEEKDADNNRHSAFQKCLTP